MARLMLSEGIFSAFAAATAVRRRGFFSTSPPDLAAMVISLIRRVKILPRLASSAPFLCLIVAHLLSPDIRYLAWILRCWRPRFEPLYGRTGLRRAQETTKDYSSGRARIPNLVP